MVNPKILIISFLLILSQAFTVSFAALPLTDAAGNKLPTLAPMLKKVNPAVVNIATYSTQRINNPLLNDPFFRYFFNIPGNGNQQAPQRRQQSAGSGVIVDAKKGTVITNYHVIKDADEVHVSLNDGRSFLAKVIGVDKELDVAVLHIDAKNLVAAKMADSDKLEVGDFVLAIGNPFALGQTVTTGIVSALGRTGLGIEGYENFIQTDASINPGNSGGALVDLAGDLIGINTAIIAPSGGNVGIGFAIPINMVKASMEQILKHGKVTRGEVGINIQDITPDLQSAFNLKNGQQGVLVTGVANHSPAKKSGIKPGDVIVAVNGEKTISTGILRSQIGVHSVGDNVKLSIIRNGEKKDITVKIGKMQKLSASSDELNPLLRGVQFAKNQDGDGVVITAIAPNSPAAYSGLRAGDIIVSVNREPVNDLTSLKRALSKDKKKVLMHVDRGDGSFFLVLR
jgi:Do/DeqQ family serine protease